MALVQVWNTFSFPSEKVATTEPSPPNTWPIIQKNLPQDYISIEFYLILNSTQYFKLGIVVTQLVITKATKVLTSANFSRNFYD